MCLACGKKMLVTPERKLLKLAWQLVERENFGQNVCRQKKKNNPLIFCGPCLCLRPKQPHPTYRYTSAGVLHASIYKLTCVNKFLQMTLVLGHINNLHSHIIPADIHSRTTVSYAHTQKFNTVMGRNGLIYKHTKKCPIRISSVVASLSKLNVV